MSDTEPITMHVPAEYTGGDTQAGGGQPGRAGETLFGMAVARGLWAAGDFAGFLSALSGSGGGGSLGGRTLYDAAQAGGFSGDLADFLAHLRTARTVEDITTDGGGRVRVVDHNGNAWTPDNPVPAQLHDAQGAAVDVDARLSALEEAVGQIPTEGGGSGGGGGGVVWQSTPSVVFEDFTKPLNTDYETDYRVLDIPPTHMLEPWLLIEFTMTGYVDGSHLYVIPDIFLTQQQFDDAPINLYKEGSQGRIVRGCWKLDQVTHDPNKGSYAHEPRIGIEFVGRGGGPFQATFSDVSARIAYQAL